MVQHVSIDSVAERIRKRLKGPDAASRERFARALYAGAGRDDLHGDSPDDLSGAALALWTFAERREPGRGLVRVYNPQLDTDGWTSQHTIVEVVTDDMPFLVDSVTTLLNRSQAEVRLVLHPMVDVVRDGTGRLTALAAESEGADGAPLRRESWMHVRVSAQEPSRHAGLRDGILRVLDDVRAAVEDWEKMRSACETASRGLEALGERATEAVALLRWLLGDCYTFLGYRIYDFEGDCARVRPDSGLGVLRSGLASVFDGMLTGGRRPAELDKPDLVRLTKTNRRSSVHRGVRMDAVGVKRFDAKGNVVGEHLFVGLFTSLAYGQSAREVPVIRRKVAQVLDRSGFRPGTHDHKALVHVLDTYPRDELLQIDVADLERISRGIVALQERQKIALFTRMDPFGRFVSCLVFVPRDRYDTPLRRRFRAILEEAYAGEMTDFYTLLTDSPLARLHFLVRTTPGKVPQVDEHEVEERMIDAATVWDDALRDALVEARGEGAGLATFERFRGAFPVAYTDEFPVAVAVHDVERVEQTLRTHEVAMHLYRPAEAAPGEVRFKLYLHGEATTLSDVLPMLENMGLRALREVPYRLQPDGAEAGASAAETVWIRDFALVAQDGAAIDLDAVRDRFHEAFRMVWRGDMEDDGFNRLVLRAGLSGREVTVLRACCKFLRQARSPFSQEYMEGTLARHADLARLLVELFLARFDPALQAGAEARVEDLLRRIRKSLDKVTNLDEDRILRAFLTLMDASLRTNYFQTGADGAPKPYLSIKFDSRKIPDLPRPRPLREIFVYSPRVEAIHLRGGMVARGGIRWSDRREDFRTEVLGLMKAQMVKNTVIVPVGSKGGFVVKRPPAAGGQALKDEVVACYRTLVRGLLDLTDNIDGAKILPPPSVVRRDGDDAYLVVAADKGTATFSDIANGVSAEYGFWLDDAFASGGSAGYDHKKMAITARGAWESVKRHFREMGVDAQTQDFTCAGVGDMSGDVFGNGMLQSPHIRLLAAFDHRHVFLDPSPDAARSFDERKRLFALPTSSWADYDAKTLSPGGGVWPRTAKSIPLSAETRKLLGIDADSAPPADVIRAILALDVDLLWLGGIGTYVRSSEENDAAVGDRSNDAVRIDGTQLRAKVVAEGANLGLTQRGRVEAALRGVRINTDFIDNSAGVDCSDHEVNLKILLRETERAGELTRKQRDELLAGMTDEVAALVLRDNYLQTQCLTVTQQMGVRLLDRLGRFMRALERAGRLDRGIEFLPDDEELAERANRGLGLTRPELSVLLSYAKMALYDELLASDLPDDPCLESDLAIYFPARVREKFAAQIGRHRLRREIATTMVTNQIVNRVGVTFVHEVREKCGLPAADIARAFVAARDVFRMRELWREIEAQDGKAPALLQAEFLAECGRILEHGTVWFLRAAGQGMDVAAQVEAFEGSVREIREALPGILASDQRKTYERRVAAYVEKGAPAALAERIVRLEFLSPALDIVRLARRTGLPVVAVARAYCAVGARFGFHWLRLAAAKLTRRTAWDKLAVAALLDELDAVQADLTGKIVTCDVVPPGGGASSKAMTETGTCDPSEATEAWAADRRPLVARTEQLVAELQSLPSLDLAMLAVASRQLKAMCG